MKKRTMQDYASPLGNNSGSIGIAKWWSGNESSLGTTSELNQKLDFQLSIVDTVNARCLAGLLKGKHAGQQYVAHGAAGRAAFGNNDIRRGPVNVDVMPPMRK